ncbi:DNA polymerase eta-like isoform X1 [Carica papaya]|uniref:DNA polymerase eta-like isoform X1 n=1 Tax=Carica papaya TaxID=3649 RepID=UPI000B8CFC51|nr:DNA polymerase eta-like isoform X1 [Carica papaya]
MCSYGINNQVNNNNAWRITSLSVSASKIFAVPAGTHSIMKYFHGRTASCPPSRKFLDNLIQEPAPSSPSDIHSGYGSYSELKLMDPQIVPSAEETWMKYPVPVFDQGEAKLDQLKDQGAFCSSSNDAQDLLVQQTTSLLAHDLFIQQTTPLAPLGSGKCSELNKITSHTERSKDEVCIKKRKKEPKGNTLKYNIQGKCSILKFFKRDNQPHTSLEQGHVKMTHNLKSALSQVSSSSESNHNQQPNECFFSDNQGIDGNCRLDQNEERRERCSYKFDEIDPSVIDELPPEIQHEIRAWLHPHKLPNKKGSTIDHYFLPKRTCN